MAVDVSKVETRKDMRKFIQLPWRLYKGDPNWVPPLISELKKTFNKEKFPFFEHSEADFFLARCNGETVGRIAAIKNNNHLKIYNDGVGFFGFFESIDDQKVADALFDKAIQWVKDRGLKKIRGPENYSQNEECGLLIDGFNLPPVVMMSYNPKYYQTLIETAGFEKAMDLYAYEIHEASIIPDRLARASEGLKKSGGFTIRQINMKKLDEEVEKIEAVYNQAWSENWGAVPLTEKEIEHLKKNLKQIVIPELVFIVEINGEPVGLSITIPDINEALIKINGRLFPVGIIKLLWYSRKIKRARVLIMGVLKEHRKKGIDIVMYYETFRNGLARGINTGEMSWILENNYPMRRALERLGVANIYKTYCLYEKEI